MIPVVYAQEHIEAAKNVVSRVESAILFPLMTLMMSLALLVFLWGGFQFVANADSDSGRETGKRHMLYGVIGMVVMLSAMAILKIAAGTFGCDVTTPGGCQ